MRIVRNVKQAVSLFDRSTTSALLIGVGKQADNLFSTIAASVISTAEYTHGDATLSNCVFTDEGVRLIDFSPRPAPPVQRACRLT